MTQSYHCNLIGIGEVSQSSRFSIGQNSPQKEGWFVQEPLLPRAASSPAALEPAACDAAGHAALSGPLQPDGKAVWPLEFTAAESLVQVNFWLLATIFGVGSSCAILFLNNAGQSSRPAWLTTNPVHSSHTAVCAVS